MAIDVNSALTEIVHALQGLRLSGPKGHLHASGRHGASNSQLKKGLRKVLWKRLSKELCKGLCKGLYKGLCKGSRCPDDTSRPDSARRSNPSAACE